MAHYKPVGGVSRRTFFVTGGLVALSGCASSVPGVTAGTVKPLSGRADSSAFPTATGTTPPAQPAKVTIVPANESTNVAPNTPLHVKVQNGKISAISAVTTVVATPGQSSTTTKATTTAGAASGATTNTGPAPAGAPLAGTLSPDGATWTAATGLVPGTAYKVTVTGTDEQDKPWERTTSFTTMAAKKELRFTMAPTDNQVVGVGHPIVLRLKTPVADKAALLKQIAVTSIPPVEGAWRWTKDDEAHWRPKDPWPSTTKVNVAARVTGFNAGNDTWGMTDRSVNFTIGPAHVSTVDVNAHTLTVTENGRVVKVLPISAGKKSSPTQGGWHMVIEKEATTVMDSSTVGIPAGSAGAYKLTVQWATRISHSGEFVHAAPWSVGAQGRSNVSHGCVNASMANAKWFYDFSRPGDLVNVINASKPLKADDGFSDWNVPWDQWVKG